MTLTRAELVSMASPPCHECGNPVERVEQSWSRAEEGHWTMSTFMVCGHGHRVPVEPFDD